MSTKSVSRYKKLLTTQVENLHAIPHFNTKHLVLWTTPKTLEPQWKNRLKDLGIRSGLHSQRVEFSRANTFMALSAVSTVSPIGANSDKRRWSCNEGLDRELSTCLATNYKKQTNSRWSGILTSRVTGLFHAICYLFTYEKLKLFFFCVNWMPKILVHFSYLRRYFGVDIVSRRMSVAMDYIDWKWIET